MPNPVANQCCVSGVIRAATQILGTNYINPSPAPIDITNQNSVAAMCSGNTFFQFPWYRGPSFEWMPVFGFGSDGGDSTHVSGVSGFAVNAGGLYDDGLSHGDVWFTHPFGFDWLTYVAPDSAYNGLLAPSNRVQPFKTEANIDRPGMDYRNFDLSEARPELCQAACDSDPQCTAYTYVKPGIQGPKARCWLKSDVPNSVANQCCVSGVKKPKEYVKALYEAKKLAARLGLEPPAGVLGVETDQGLIPGERAGDYRAKHGDRVAVFGRWIVDCGHDDFHTEIHPPLVLAAAREADNGKFTHSTVVGNPYLVSQTFHSNPGVLTPPCGPSGCYFDDRRPLPIHLTNEILKTINPPLEFWLGAGADQPCGPLFPPLPPPATGLTPCSTRIEAHPQFAPTPFAGNQKVFYFVRPKAPRESSGDRLRVRHQITARDGVNVSLFTGDYGDFHAPEDSVGVLISMDASKYEAQTLGRRFPPQNNGLGPNFVGAEEGPDCSISESTLYRRAPEIGEVLNALKRYLPAGFVLGRILAQGIKTDCYDPPVAESKPDAKVKGLLAEDLNGDRTVNWGWNFQPFPVHGWLDVGWERYAERQVECVPPI